MSSVTVVGIDPGMKGGVTHISSKYVDIVPLSQDMSSLKRLLADVDKVYIESQQYRPQNGRKNITTLTNYGRLLGVIESVKVAYKEIHPRTWKEALSLTGKPKSASIAKAKEMLKDIYGITWKEKLTDGMAESFLIAEYGKRTEGK